MLVKIAVVALLLVIIGSLASAFFSMIGDGADSHRTVKALSWRIGLSVAAFAILMLGAAFGFIDSNAVLVGG